MRSRPYLRACNALISAAMLLLFLVHGVGNAFQMIGVGSPLSKVLSRTLLVLCIIHAVIGCITTLDSLSASSDAEVSYPKLNKRFWVVRLSGLALAALIAFHALMFLHPSENPLRLAPFHTLQLAGNILLVLALAVHVLANMHPLMVSLGVPAPRARAADIAVAVSIMLVFMGVAFIIYYLRWVAL